MQDSYFAIENDKLNQNQVNTINYSENVKKKLKGKGRWIVAYVMIQ